MIGNCNKSRLILADLVINPAIVLRDSGVHTRYIRSSASFAGDKAGEPSLNPISIVLDHQWTSRITLQIQQAVMLHVSSYTTWHCHKLIPQDLDLLTMHMSFPPSGKPAHIILFVIEPGLPVYALAQTVLLTIGICTSCRFFGRNISVEKLKTFSNMFSIMKPVE